MEGQWRVAEARASTNQQIPEQPHRTGPPALKQRMRPMLGLKSFRTAAVVISGIELAEKIKKKQFHMSKLGGLTAPMPEIWQAALAA
jgi:putative transposase